MMLNFVSYISILLAAIVFVGCSEGPWNNPYPAEENELNIHYAPFSGRPKHLDPAQSYSSNEIAFTAQIYEPPLQYHFLKRPYELIPLTTTSVPKAVYIDKDGNQLPVDAAIEDIAYTLYDIEIQPGIMYQPHPAFAKDAEGKPLYLNLSPDHIAEIFNLGDFPETGSRELVASDYIYEIKRLANPRIHSPIFGLMSEYIVGLADFRKKLIEVDQQLSKDQGESAFLDLSQYDLEGVQLLDRYTYRVKIYGKYPQFLFWLAMPFFAPIPPEADEFYSQPGLDKKNVTLDWYPIGTGPYMLTENNPNMRMVMEKNPNFHGELYPAEGEPSDREEGYLADENKPLPFIDKVVRTLEKEDIPAWNKFLQGYYDASGITSDSFDQAIRFNTQGEAGLSEDMQDKGIKLITAIGTSTYYMGFNMNDSVIGGLDEKNRKLRQAISIAIDYEEFISIFLNGRGIAAQGPLPPGLFGYREGEAGINPYVYDWMDGKPQRKSIDEAKKLLGEAGYPNGRDEQTGKPLIIYFDTTATGPDDKSRMDWFRKQFQKLNIQLVVRGTDYNRFQDKMLKGTAQLFQWGWNADYPDPENFLFLLYGPNEKLDKNGENAANYKNPEFDRLFEKMKNMDNGPQRQAIIDDMVDIARRDSPWIWGLHPKQFSLYHKWYFNAKPNLMANNTLKYRRIDPQVRSELRAQWNQAVVWPIVAVVIVFLLGIVPAAISYRAKIKSKGVS
ncbi:MAG: peptide ABC transporter substrate-binding protein [Gammaproteobacteria bacterium SG8_11]|nr:MAG: peptide ABC transporter substrate-binding protein [Gammaproteobacteria bacterium SG8_11]